MENTCKDCCYFLAIDVFKGMCKMDKASISHDSLACGHFSKIAKCKFCSKYKQETEFLGICMDQVAAHPDLVAIHCDSFEWIGMN
ncbi:MAG: 4-hydroxyphenylacetate decarboxylase small subunit [Bacteroidetes bacterium]|nr:4-hydroxyphenylacetate decarboxylase small subunit [Bacteroidota bacterium]